MSSRNIVDYLLFGLLIFGYFNVVHSGTLRMFSLAQTGSDFGPLPVALMDREIIQRIRNYGGGEGGGAMKTKINSGEGNDSNNIASDNNNNLSNSLSSINQDSNNVISNTNNVNQITVSILPVPG